MFGFACQCTFVHLASPSYVCLCVCLNPFLDLWVPPRPAVWAFRVASVCQCLCISHLLWICFLAPGGIEGFGVCVAAEYLSCCVGVAFLCVRVTHNSSPVCCFVWVGLCHRLGLGPIWLSLSGWVRGDRGGEHCWSWPRAGLWGHIPGQRVELSGQNSAHGHGWVGCAGLEQAQVSREAQETTQLAWALGLLGAGLEPGYFLRLCIIWGKPLSGDC